MSIAAKLVLPLQHKSDLAAVFILHQKTLQCRKLPIPGDHTDPMDAEHARNFVFIVGVTSIELIVLRHMRTRIRATERSDERPTR